MLSGSARLLAAALLIAGSTFPAVAQHPVDRWVERLKSPVLRDRLSASYDYSKLVTDPANTVPALLKALRHRDATIREHAAAALGEIPAPSGITVPALLQALRDAEPTVQGQATLALAKIGEPAALAIVRALLGPGAFTEPKANALLWEDYAVAALKLMQEKSARPVARGLASLAGHSRVCEPPVLINRQAGPTAGWIVRPGYAGGEFRFHLLLSVATRGPALGGRIGAAELLEAANGQAPLLRTKFENLAFDILERTAWRGARLIDPEAGRTNALAKFLAAHRCGNSPGSSVRSGDLAIAAIRQAVSANATERAAALIENARVDGPVAELWAPRLEQYLSAPEPKVREAAVTWLARNSDSAVPLSERLLVRLARNGDDPTAITAATYLQGLGYSDAAADAFGALLRRPRLDESSRAAILRYIRETTLPGGPIEPPLRELAAAATAGEEKERSCEAVAALSAIGPLSEETRTLVIAAVRSDRCTREAVEVLARQGLRSEQVLAAAAVPAASKRAAEILEILGGDLGSGSGLAAEDKELLFNEPEADLSEATLLERIAADKLLSQRKVAGALPPGGQMSPFWLPSAYTVDEHIALLERLDATDVDQTSPVFAALTDLRVFKLVHDEVEEAAASRLVLANPELPPLAGERDAAEFARRLPKWPWSWPPPKYSAWSVISLAALPGRPTIGTVFDRLIAALERGGLRENRIYAIPSGVGILTHLEETTPEGRPLAGDDRLTDKRGGLSFVRLVSETFTGIRSHYRLFAFFMTPQLNISGGRGTLPLDQARNPSVDGARELPPEIRGLPWNHFRLHVVTYRFSKVNSKVTLVTRDHASTEQLKRAGVLLFLTGRT
jgi:hypothetical protein